MGLGPTGDSESDPVARAAIYLRSLYERQNYQIEGNGSGDPWLNDYPQARVEIQALGDRLAEMGPKAREDFLKITQENIHVRGARDTLVPALRRRFPGLMEDFESVGKLLEGDRDEFDRRQEDLGNNQTPAVPEEPPLQMEGSYGDADLQARVAEFNERSGQNWKVAPGGASVYLEVSGPEEMMAVADTIKGRIVAGDGVDIIGGTDVIIPGKTVVVMDADGFMGLPDAKLGDIASDLHAAESSDPVVQPDGVANAVPEGAGIIRNMNPGLSIR